MARIYVTDIYGNEHMVEGTAGRRLMEILREYEFGVAASCGGVFAGMQAANARRQTNSMRS